MFRLSAVVCAAVWMAVPALSQVDPFRPVAQAEALARVAASEMTQATDAAALYEIDLDALTAVALEGGELRVPSLQGSIIGLADREASRSEGYAVTVRSADGARAVFGVADGVLHGLVWRGDERAVIQHVGGGVYSLQAPPATALSCGVDHLSIVDLPPAPAEAQRAQRERVQANQGVDVIHVLAVYTAAAQAWASPSSVGAYVQAAIGRANVALTDAAVDARFEVVDTRAISYVESGDSGVDLERLTFSQGSQADPDGYMDEVQGYRDAAGADLVALIASVEDTGGIAWVMTDMGNPGFEALGYSLTRVQQIGFTETLTHEMGHNLGLFHEAGASQPPPPADSRARPWSLGWTSIPGRFRTIMSYGTECGNAGVSCTGLNAFSDPTRTYNGEPMGDAGTADAARLLAESAPYAAAYRAPASTGTPGNPPGGPGGPPPPPAIGVAVGLRAVLAGAYDASAGAMRTALLAAGRLPTTQPYGSPRYAGTPALYTGGESASATLATSAEVVDWVLVELRASATGAPVSRRAALLLSDGVVVGPDGSSGVLFDNASPGSYYVVVRHRNHLPVMSAAAVDLSSGTAAYDFTTSAAQSYSTTGVATRGAGPGGGAPFALWAGDADLDGRLLASDYQGAWRDQNGAEGYLSADFELDGRVLASDYQNELRPQTGRRESQVPESN